MKKSCPYCGRIHEKKFSCPKKPKPMKKGSTKITGFRSSAEWQRTRAGIIARDNYLCRVCLENGVLTSGDLQVHHIVPLSEDFTKRTDADNLVTLCPRCHEDAERGEIPRERLREIIKGSPPCPGTG